jgi:hypothetical protein
MQLGYSIPDSVPGIDPRPLAGLKNPTQSRICKRLRSSRINSKESIPGLLKRQIRALGLITNGNMYQARVMKIATSLLQFITNGKLMLRFFSFFPSIMYPT